MKYPLQDPDRVIEGYTACTVTEDVPKNGGVKIVCPCLRLISLPQLMSLPNSITRQIKKTDKTKSVQTEGCCLECPDSPGERQ